MKLRKHIRERGWWYAIGTALAIAVIGEAVHTGWQWAEDNHRKEQERLDCIPRLVESISNQQAQLIQFQQELENYRVADSRRFWTNYAPLEDRVLMLEEKVKP